MQSMICRYRAGKSSMQVIQIKKNEQNSTCKLADLPDRPPPPLKKKQPKNIH